MEELKSLLDALTASDKEQLKAYQGDVQHAKSEIELHENKIRYYNELVKQREKFIHDIEAKLKKIESLEEKIIKKLT